jgi:triosephosphate isomerase
MNSLKLTQLFSRNKRFIGGNWKSNNGLNDTKTLMEQTINKLNYNTNNVGKYFFNKLILDVIIAPVSLHIPVVAQLNKNSNIKIAAQNSSNYNFGAYTGEISPKHLKDFGLEWVILGHSERRTIFKEND